MYVYKGNNVVMIEDGYNDKLSSVPAKDGLDVYVVYDKCKRRRACC